MFRIQMLNQDESHSCIGGKIGQEFGESFDTAGGGAHGGN